MPVPLPCPSHPISPPQEEIHIWQADLTVTLSQQAQLATLLSSDEQARAERYRFERDRRRFMVGRGLLRLLVGMYLQTSPRQLTFCYSPQGKPGLIRADQAAHPLVFNVSHSGEMAVYGFGWQRDLGIDVEQTRRILDVETLAQRFFSPQEFQYLQDLPSPEAKQRVFFQLWTAKEACLKATGEGIGELSRIAFDLSSPTLRLKHRSAAMATKPWTLEQWIPQSDYVATVAVEGSIPHINCWHLDTVRLGRFSKVDIPPLSQG